MKTFGNCVSNAVLIMARIPCNQHVRHLSQKLATLDRNDESLVEKPWLDQLAFSLECRPMATLDTPACSLLVIANRGPYAG